MKKRKNRQIRFVCIVVLLVSAITFACNNFNTESNVETRAVTYVVEENDTLWDIALAFNYDQKDPREVVYEIREHNKIDTRIYPGQVIAIPITIKVSNEDYEIASR